MVDIIKVRIPVDYVNINGTNNNLLYKEIETVIENKSKYDDYSTRIEKLFDNIISNQDLSNRLKKLIDESFNDKKALIFIMDNQWILRFAKATDVDRLISNPKFIVNKVIVKLPYSAYLNGGSSKLYTKDILVPIWEKHKVKEKIDLITWLFTDTYNTFEERLNAFILGNEAEAGNILRDNSWILMYLKEDKRVQIMDKFNIESSSFIRTIGLDASKELIRNKMIVPVDLLSKYQRIELEINDLFRFSNDTLSSKLIAYVYKHSNYTCVYDENELLRENLWLLDLVSDIDKKKILQLLGISLEEKKKRITVFQPKINEKGYYVYQLDIITEEYDRYRKLNDELSALMIKGDLLTEEEVIDFVNSDQLVLKIWPWLKSYIKSDDKKSFINNKRKQ